MNRRLGPTLTLVVSALIAAPARAAERPNILWLVCEDASASWFGCYGNPQAHTPNVDALARSGYRYTRAFACAPVCAPSRSSWITGVAAVSTGTQPMRSRYPIPHDQIRYYPDDLRAAGYFTANHSKTDYNIGGRPDAACWDSNGANAWDLRKPGQPFFQVINFNSSHESAAHGDVTRTEHSPRDVTLARYHPDEPGIRQTYAKYHDAVARMDAEVGRALEALAKAGLAEDTVVIFNSDHGGVMPRSKRFLFDSGVHAPLIVRVPEKFRHLRPEGPPGTAVGRLVSFIDMPKTWLSLAGAKVPGVMQGRVFLGPATEPEPPCVFGFRGRMDERFDCQRSARDGRFVYIKNYMPFVPWGQHLDYLWLMQATRSWEDAHRQGRTDAITGRFFGPKPVEELYDSDADPDNVVNLAARPEHRGTLQAMRSRLREWQLAVRDTGLLPEFERDRRARENKTTIYEMAREPRLYDLPGYLDAADLALAGDPANPPRHVAALESDDSAIRYWGVVGLLILGDPTEEARKALGARLDDPCGEVRAFAAWALLRTGDADRGRQALAAMIRDHAPATLMALNVLDWSRADLTPFVAPMDALPTSGDAMVGYEQRMVEHLRASHGLSPAAPPSRPARAKAKVQGRRATSPDP